MRRYGLILAAFLPLVFPCSCGSGDNSRPLIQGEFVVRLDPVEGGCWVLVATDNTVYSPIHLDDTCRVDGIRVRASILPRPDMAGFCPGAIVQVIGIETSP